jgi:hypothetical protein
MQCHLGLCASFRSDFTLKPLACSLASEDPNENAQPVVAATIDDASWYSVASLPTIAFPSRPNHNAAAPYAKSMSAFG